MEKGRWWFSKCCYWCSCGKYVNIDGEYIVVVVVVIVVAVVVVVDDDGEYIDVWEHSTRLNLFLMCIFGINYIFHCVFRYWWFVSLCIVDIDDLFHKQYEVTVARERDMWGYDVHALTFTHIYTCSQTHTHTHIHIHIYTHLYTSYLWRVRLHTHHYTHTHTHTYSYTLIYSHILTHTHAHTHAQSANDKTSSDSCRWVSFPPPPLPPRPLTTWFYKLYITTISSPLHSNYYDLQHHNTTFIVLQTTS